MPAIAKKGRKKSAEKHDIFRYNAAFLKKYGPINGRQANAFVNYEPPSARARLRSSEGKELRNNAEKSVLINEYFLDLFVPPNGLVYDMFAGTGSMALACIKTHRNYVGSEPEQDVHAWATQRIGKA